MLQEDTEQISNHTYIEYQQLISILRTPYPPTVESFYLFFDR